MKSFSIGASFARKAVLSSASRSSVGVSPQVERMLAESSEDCAWRDPRWGQDVLWSLHRSPEDRHAARLRLLRAFEDVLERNNIGPHDRVVMVFDRPGVGVQESILLAHARHRLGLPEMRVLLCDNAVSGSALMDLPRFAGLGVTLEVLPQREQLPNLLKVLAEDHRVVLNALFCDEGHASGDPVLAECAQTAEPFGLMFDRRAFFRDDLIADLTPFKTTATQAP